jgi:hypothetical protein
MEQSLLAMRSEGEESDPTTTALKEAEDAVSAVSFHGRQSIELPPQNGYIRRLQHDLANRHGLKSTSRGREPYRRVTISAGRAAPNRDLPWNSPSS